MKGSEGLEFPVCPSFAKGNLVQQGAFSRPNAPCRRPPDTRLPSRLQAPPRHTHFRIVGDANLPSRATIERYDVGRHHWLNLRRRPVWLSLLLDLLVDLLVDLLADLLTDLLADLLADLPVDLLINLFRDVLIDLLGGLNLRRRPVWLASVGARCRLVCSLANGLVEPMAGTSSPDSSVDILADVLVDLLIDLLRDLLIDLLRRRGASVLASLMRSSP